MNSLIAALLWILLYATTLGLLIFGLRRRAERIVKLFQGMRRSRSGNSLALLADLHVRRALWFAMLDNMQERYTLLLRAARASHNDRNRST
jgi:hypothetical protein